MSSQRVVLHVGTPKSGTTYLQDLMWASRPALAQAGVSYPGDHPGAHFHAALDAKRESFHGWVDPDVPGAWSRLVTAARDHEGTTVISHELFGDLTADQAAAALADLDFAEVHVVVTARDLSRTLPAVWQENVKNRSPMPFPHYLDIVCPGSRRSGAPYHPVGDEDGYATEFWLRQDLPALLRRWGATLPPSRVHLVTVPPAGTDPALLWERFAEVLDVDPALASLPEGRRNQSLGQVESELLRRLNERLGDDLEWPVHEARITHLLGRVALPAREGAVPLTLPADVRDWAAARADVMLDELAGLDFHVVGDVDDLLVAESRREEVDRTPEAGDLLDAALDALIALVPVPEALPAAPPPAPEAEVSDTDPAILVDADAAFVAPRDRGNLQGVGLRRWLQQARSLARRPPTRVATPG
ncbi:hypothetical protein E4P41_11155 [Geodermatophilus sp. DF01-2]|uniref:hypothetical protein n=1 Tax=Geodermatophilus sp. DF01-2 TaxID=2559610 RepID=UPI001073BCA8|nr:hypothetical protein [Geodermatophilus sp. DF01_2]TFV59870.1 hypothetical protein E4P41_11155 [Geodermatophilus sp. DF01_2]